MDSVFHCNILFAWLTQFSSVGDQCRVRDARHSNIVRNLAKRTLEAAQSLQRACVDLATVRIVRQPQAEAAYHAVARPDLLIGLVRTEQSQLTTVRKQDTLGMRAS